MAYNTSAVAAGEKTSLLADLPFLLSVNVLENFVTGAQWRTAGDWTTGSDDTATGFPTSRVHDGRLNLMTKPTTAGTTHYLIFDLTASTTDAGTIDTVFIGSHNLGDLTAAALSVEIDDNNDFSTSINIKAAATLIGNKREIVWDLGSLGDFAQYNNVQWLRIKITSGASEIPQLGEVVIGKRYQLPHAPNYPHDNKPLESSVSDFVAKSGNRTRYTKYKGRLVFSPRWSPTDGDRNSIDTISQLRNWFKYTDYGTRPFLWVGDSPYTNRTDVRSTVRGHWMYMDPSFELPANGSNAREAAFTFEEEAPFLELE